MQVCVSLTADTIVIQLPDQARIEAALATKAVDGDVRRYAATFEGDGICAATFFTRDEQLFITIAAPGTDLSPELIRPPPRKTQLFALRAVDDDNALGAFMQGAWAGTRTIAGSTGDVVLTFAAKTFAIAFADGSVGGDFCARAHVCQEAVMVDRSHYVQLDLTFADGVEAKALVAVGWSGELWAAPKSNICLLLARPKKPRAVEVRLAEGCQVFQLERMTSAAPPPPL